MDDKIAINDLKDEVKKFCEEREWDQFHNPKDLAIGIITEASELLELFRFKNELESIQLFESSDDFEKIKDEIADIFFFILRFSQINNIDLSSSLINKIDKNSRRYTIDKSKGNNIKILGDK